MSEIETKTTCLHCDNVLTVDEQRRKTCPHCNANMEVRRDATVRVAPIAVFAEATL